MPSSHSLPACRSTVAPSSSMCSFRAIPAFARARSRDSRALHSASGSGRKSTPSSFSRFGSHRRPCAAGGARRIRQPSSPAPDQISPERLRDRRKNGVRHEPGSVGATRLLAMRRPTGCVITAGLDRQSRCRLPSPLGKAASTVQSFRLIVHSTPSGWNECKTSARRRLC
jgi:hypothetical protein